MVVDEIMPIFQAGRATHQKVMNSIRLFGKYVIPHFQEKEKASLAGLCTLKRHSRAIL